MAKLGKHIYPQVFDIDNQIDYNYAIFPDSFTFGGPTGGTGAGTSSFYYDYSSITNWSDIRDIVTASCVFIIDQMDILYQATGGSAAFSGLPTSDKEALSKSFLIPKAERDLIHTEAEQRRFAEELYLCNEQVHEYNTLINSVDFIVTSDNTDVQSYLNNSINFTVPGSIGGSGGSGSVVSVNGQIGNVILGLNELDDVNTSGISTNHILTYNGANWTAELRPPLTIHTSSQNYLNYNSTTGELFMENLAITNVTVNNTATSASDWFSNPSNASTHQEGDTIVFTNTPFDTEVYIHNGGSSLSFSDYTKIKSGSSSDAYTRSLFSGTSPISYNTLTGGISMTQSGTQSDGFLSQSDFNLFNNKVDSVNGKTGNVTLSTSNITEGFNLYYTDTRSRNSISGGTGINYNNLNGEVIFNSNDIVGKGLITTNGITMETSLVPNSGLSFSNGSVDLLIGSGLKNTIGVIEANINDFSINSITELWSANKINSEIQSIIGGTYFVNSINGNSGNVILNSDDINEGITNLYFTESLARNSISISASSSSYLSYDNTTGIFDIKSLAIADVTVDDIATQSSSYFSNNYTGTEHQEGDTIVMTAITDGTEIYIHNGGVSGTSTDFIQIESPHVTDSYVKSLISSTLPIKYSTSTGIIAMDISSSLSDGYLSASDWGEFNSKVSYSDSLARNAFSATPPISYESVTGLFSIPKATTSINGYLDTFDFIKFDNKIDSINGITGASISFGINDLNDVSTSSTPNINDLLKWDGTNWTPTNNRKSWTFGAARNSDNATNIYLNQYNDIPTNQSPYITFFDCKIKNMSVSTNVNETWIAEVRVNDVVSASMSISSLSASYSTVNVNVTAGDKISFYCNGTNIDRPNIQILLEEI